MKIEKKRVFRSYQYRKVNKEHLKKLALAGWTDVQMADFFNIPVSTLYRWKRKYPDFRKKLLDWKAEADERVEKSLLKRALGYDYVETVKELRDEKMVVVKETSKHVSPSDTSIMNWLTNRLRGDWRRTREEDAKDPLSVAVYNLIKNNGNGKKTGNGKKDGNGKVTVDSSVKIIRGGLQVVD